MKKLTFIILKAFFVIYPFSILQAEIDRSWVGPALFASSVILVKILPKIQVSKQATASVRTTDDAHKKNSFSFSSKGRPCYPGSISLQRSATSSQQITPTASFPSLQDNVSEVRPNHAPNPHFSQQAQNFMPNSSNNNLRQRAWSTTSYHSLTPTSGQTTTSESFTSTSSVKRNSHATTIITKKQRLSKQVKEAIEWLLQQIESYRKKTEQEKIAYAQFVLGHTPKYTDMSIDDKNLVLQKIEKIITSKKAE